MQVAASVNDPASCEVTSLIRASVTEFWLGALFQELPLVARRRGRPKKAVAPSLAVPSASQKKDALTEFLRDALGCQVLGRFFLPITMTTVRDHVAAQMLFRNLMDECSIASPTPPKHSSSKLALLPTTPTCSL